MAGSTTTYLGPLTTLFTPAPSCTSLWTYEGSLYNQQSAGLLIQPVFDSYPDLACYPQSFSYAGRLQNTYQVFSPGICPEGYTTASEAVNVPVSGNVADGTTSAVCCKSDFEYYTTVSSGYLFFGCISTWGDDSSTTVVPGRADLNNTITPLTETTVTGPLTMWGQPVTVEFQQKDLSLFPQTATSSKTASPGSGSSAGSSIAATSTSPSSPTASSDSSASTISTGAKTGIGIGAALGVIALIGFLVFFMRQRRKGAAIRRADELYVSQSHPMMVESDAKEVPPELPGTQAYGQGKFARHEADERYELS